MRRAVFFTCFLYLVGSSVLAARQSATGVRAQPWAKFLGSWKDVPGPDDPSEPRIEPESDSMKFSFNCKKDGSCLDVIIGRYDGKANKDIASLTWEAGSERQAADPCKKTGFRAESPAPRSSGSSQRTARR